MRFFITSILLAGSLLNGCTGLSPADACLKNAFDDYQIARDKHMLDPPAERFAEKVFAKDAWYNAARECQIRHGEPNDTAQTSKWAAEVSSDRLW